MHSYSASCQCGSVSFDMALPLTISEYSPRKCDCNFCMERDIRYLSDPKGSLHIRSQVPLLMQKQGSEKALFVTCTKCHDVIAATINTGNGLVGAVNASLIQDAEQCQADTVVSPKKLSAEEKVARWLTVWQPVSIDDQTEA